MKFAMFLCLLIFATNCSSAQSVSNREVSKDQSLKIQTPAKQAVLVELFTSEG